MKYGETSLILDMLTREQGRRSFIIGGVRKAASRISPGLLKPMALIDIVAYDRPDRELNRLKEVRADFVYEHLPFELVRGTIGLFMIELVQKAVRVSEPDYELFDFVARAFSELDGTESSTGTWHLAFALHLAGFLGFAPSGWHDAERPCFDLKLGRFSAGHGQPERLLDADTSRLLGDLLELDVTESHRVQASRSQRLALADGIVRYYQYHVDGFAGLNSLEVLRAVMKS